MTPEQRPVRWPYALAMALAALVVLAYIVAAIGPEIIVPIVFGLIVWVGGSLGTR